jgi:hypothetical protein
MSRIKKEFIEDVNSGDPDKVNAALEEVRVMELEKRADLFVECFDDLVAVYNEGDGYQRLSVVRFLRDLSVPQLPAEYRDKLWEFYLEAIQDDDGRVRRSTGKGIQGFAVKNQYVGEEIEPLKTDLERVAKKHTDKKREHIEEAIHQLESLLRSPIDKMFDEIDTETEGLGS